MSLLFIAGNVQPSMLTVFCPTGNKKPPSSADNLNRLVQALNITLGDSFTDSNNSAAIKSVVSEQKND